MSIKSLSKNSDGMWEVYYEGGFHYLGEGKELDESFIREGKGILTFIKQHHSNRKIKEIYSGEWVNNKKNGKGRIIYISEAEYEGEWKNDQHHGRGMYKFSDGGYYEGEWNNHQIHGSGIYVDKQHRKWIGEFSNGGFSSLNQYELKKKKIKNNIIFSRLKFGNQFLKKCNNAFVIQKKTMKENSKEIFVSIPDRFKKSVAFEAIKFEDRKPDFWTRIFEGISDSGSTLTNISNPEEEKLITDKNKINQWSAIEDFIYGLKFKSGDTLFSLILLIENDNEIYILDAQEENGGIPKKNK